MCFFSSCCVLLLFCFCSFPFFSFFFFPSSFFLPLPPSYGLLGVKLPPVTDEDFIVWMRTAGLPTFKKLYRVINRDLKAGDVLTVQVLNYYPVKAFSGQKAIVLSTTSWLGGKNNFLGWAYIVVGIICFTLAIAFLIKHLVSPRPLGDMSYFSWPGAAATAAPTNRAGQH